MPIFVGSAQVQKMYIGSAEISAAANLGSNVLGPAGSFPGITDSSLYLPLKTSIVPSRGSSTPTFTRATVAWSFDNEGKLNLNIPSGCVRFKGGRLVRNHVVNSSENITSGGKTAVTTPNATTVLCNAGNTNHYLSRAAGVTAVVGHTYLFTIRLQYSNHKFVQLFFPNTIFASKYANFNLETGELNNVSHDYINVTNVSAGVWDVSYAGTVISAGTASGIIAFVTNLSSSRLSTYDAVGTEEFKILRVQIENVSGQADQTASEYVSVGVLSSPYHGAGTVSGADGCKWFPTNKNGSAISASTLEGYLSEPVRTNNCLWGRDLRNSLWDKSSTGAELLTNGTFADATSWTTTGPSYFSISGGVININAPDSTAAYIDNSQLFSVLVPGKQYVVEFDYVKTSGGSPDVNLMGSSGKTVSSSTGRKSITITCGSSVVGYGLRFGQFGACVGTIDNVSVKEAAIQVTTTTGLDNVANSASRLIAAANDATLLQLLTAATGTRTLSAYIKRVSGTGTISLTRNGGTGWTDITSSLVTGSWVLVQMTSDVGANPTVGIKMGTSGDVIDVDCVQDENGAWATSPILTTTAAVTRNADVLSYASAFDVAQGTALCSVMSSIPINSGSQTIILDSTNCVIMYLNSASARTTTLSYDGLNTATVTGNDITTAICKRAVRWGADLRMAADGMLGTATAFDGGMGASGTIEIAGEYGIQLSGTIRDVHIWPTPLTDAQMQQVTR